MQTDFSHTPPLLYRIAKAGDRRRITGSWRLLQALKALHLVPPVDFPLTNGVGVIVPIAVRPYDLIDVALYEGDPGQPTVMLVHKVIVPTAKVTSPRKKAKASARRQKR